MTAFSLASQIPTLLGGHCLSDSLHISLKHKSCYYHLCFVLQVVHAQGLGLAALLPDVSSFRGLLTSPSAAALFNLLAPVVPQICCAFSHTQALYSVFAMPLMPFLLLPSHLWVIPYTPLRLPPYKVLPGRLCMFPTPTPLQSNSVPLTSNMVVLPL